MRQFSSSGLLGGGSSSNSGATSSETQSAASSTVFAEAGNAGCIGGGGAGCSGAVAGSTNVGAASIGGGRARLRSKEGSMDSTDSGVSSLRYHILVFLYFSGDFSIRKILTFPLTPSGIEVVLVKREKICISHLRPRTYKKLHCKMVS